MIGRALMQHCLLKVTDNNTLKLGTTYVEHHVYFVYLLVEFCCKRVFVLM
jgi:hypothetical protein